MAESSFATDSPILAGEYLSHPCSNAGLLAVPVIANAPLNAFWKRPWQVYESDPSFMPRNEPWLRLKSKDECFQR